MKTEAEDDRALKVSKRCKLAGRAELVLFELGLGLALASLPAPASADRALTLVPIEASQIRVDGELGDWKGARFARLGDLDDRSLAFALGFDGSALYLAARVWDDDFVRSAAPTPSEDAIVLTLVAPREQGGFHTTELWLYAGVPGKLGAKLAIGESGTEPVVISDAKLVEGPFESEHGYVLEAKLELSQLPAPENLPIGRGAIRLHDIDASGRGQVTTARGSAHALPPLLFDGGPNAALEAFARSKGLDASRPRFELHGDLTGDARLERVLVLGTLVVIAGASEQGGFRYADLPAVMASDIERAELLETADARRELVVTLRLPSQPGLHTFVWDGARFVARRAVEPSQPSQLEAQQAPPSLRAGSAPAPASEPAPEQRVQTVVHAEPPGTDALIAAFRSARGLDPAVRARFVTHANVAGDSRIESLLVLDRELLVVGSGFREGTGYFYFGLPVREGADVLRVFTGDVDCNGRREIFVRVRQRIDDVQRELLFGYTFTGETLSPIVATEVRRAQGEHSVGNIVSLVREGRCYALHIEPGVARGFGAHNYPFVTESTDGYGRLLLPWLDRTARYRFEGASLILR